MNLLVKLKTNKKKQKLLLNSINNKVAPIVVDKSFADSLKKYAELIAKNVLSNKRGGMNLSDDVKVL